MAIEKTTEGMKYNWELSKVGMQITLFPVKGRHNYDAIKRAKKEVRDAHNIVIVDLEWISINDEKLLEVTTPQIVLTKTKS